MAFPAQFLDEIRNRLSCSAVIGRRVRLVKKGREHSGLCPFHNEKTPSFTVNDDKGFFHCFGCGAHGDVIGFTMRIDSLSFPDAVERLAGEAGLEVPRASPADAAREQRRKTLGDVTEAAAQWFEKMLRSAAGRTGLDYLRGRGLSDATIAAFRLGFAPEGRDLLKRALKTAGIDEALMLEAGLIVRPDDGRESFDFFRGRVMFPIADRRGQIIAFGGRVMGDGQPKYLNSRDTPLFDKGRNLYALDKARVATKDGGEIIVAEGYMDVIALHAHGFRGAVAPLGTALTEAQLELIWRLAPEPILCLDGDAAGQRAALRAAERALPLLKPGKSLRFAVLPAGEDPDSLLRSGGQDALRETLGRAQPLVEVIWQAAIRDQKLDTPERRAALEAELERRIAGIADGAVQAQYRAEIRNRLWSLFRPAAARRLPRQAGFQRNARSARGREPEPVRLGAIPAPSEQRSAQFLVAAVIAFPALLEDDQEMFARLETGDALLDGLRRAILGAFAGDPALDREGLRLHLNAAGFEGIVARLLETSVYKDLGFNRADALDLVRERWRKALLELHKRGAREELRQAASSQFSADELTEEWWRKVSEMQREITRTQAEEIDDEPPFTSPLLPRAGGSSS